MSTKRQKKGWENGLPTLSTEDRALFLKAWETTRIQHGPSMTFYLPGMIKCGNIRGRYPAISLTGNKCELQCEHCRGKLLGPMVKVSNSEELIRISRDLVSKGGCGMLLTGGSDKKGELPWQNYAHAIEKIAKETSLFLSAHTGFPSRETSSLLKSIGIRQALIDVMGDAHTATRIYHLDGLQRAITSLEEISRSGLELAPHIVAGMSYGKMRGEEKALKIIKAYEPAVLVIVVLTPLKGTPMAGVQPPHPLEVARLIAKARLLMPRVPVSLGCERPRNTDGLLLEKLAFHAGVTRMAVWSEKAIEYAVHLGLLPRFQLTCCSIEFKDNFAAPVIA